jgi:hypothetical protein
MENIVNMMFTQAITRIPHLFFIAKEMGRIVDAFNHGSAEHSLLQASKLFY